MSKAFLPLRSLLCVALPLTLAAGCASHPGPRAVGAGEDQSASPMIDTGTAAGETGTATNNTDFYAPPAGASPQDWALANELRRLLCSNPALPAQGFNAVVKDGKVTLRGGGLTKSEWRKLEAAIAQVPGVRSVTNQPAQR